MPTILNALLKQYVDDICKIYGKKLKAVILYGSYARGDFKPDSDIDIMILVDMTDEEIKMKGRALSDLTFDYNFDNELKIMPIVKTKGILINGLERIHSTIISKRRGGVVCSLIWTIWVEQNS